MGLTPTLDAIREAIKDTSIQVSAGDFTETWVLRHVKWTGRFCNIVLKDLGSSIRTFVLRDHTVDGANALIVWAEGNLQRTIDDKWEKYLEENE